MTLEFYSKYLTCDRRSCRNRGEYPVCCSPYFGSCNIVMRRVVKDQIGRWAQDIPREELLPELPQDRERRG